MGNPHSPGDGSISLEKGVDQGQAKQYKSTLIEAHFSQDIQNMLLSHAKSILTKSQSKKR